MKDQDRENHGPQHGKITNVNLKRSQILWIAFSQLKNSSDIDTCNSDKLLIYSTLLSLIKE